MGPAEPNASAQLTVALDDAAARRLLAWVDAVPGVDHVEGYPHHLMQVARSLLAAGFDALTASRAITVLNDALTRRLLQLAQQQLGPPPCPYAWLVLGSGGRREQALVSDQDNALAYAGDAPDDAGAYFSGLADQVVAGLHRAGFPHCPGGYMATSWHRPLGAWQATFENWVERPEPQGLVEAEVFLDFRPVSGDLRLDQLEDILRRGADRPRFLTMMARAAVGFEPPLRFGRIRSHGGAVDLKRGGLAAIVLLARLYALQARSLARHTTERLAAAAEAETLSRSSATTLTASYELLADIRLRAQLRKTAHGLPPDNLVSLEDLTTKERDQVRDAFRVVRDRQRATALQFYTDAVT